MVALYETNHILHSEEAEQGPACGRWPMHLSLAFIGGVSFALWGLIVLLVAIL